MKSLIRLANVCYSGVLIFTFLTFEFKGLIITSCVLFCLAGTLLFNDQTNVNKKHVTEQSAYITPLATQKESASPHSSVRNEGRLSTIRKHDKHAMVSNNNIMDARYESKISNQSKSNKSLGTVQSDKDSTSTTPMQNKKSNTAQNKKLARQKFSFENELPVKDPGPYSPSNTEHFTKNQGDAILSTASESKSNIDTQLRSQVHKLYLQHQEDIKLVKESDVGLVIPETIVSRLAKPHSRNTSNILKSQEQIQLSDTLDNNQLQPDVVPEKEMAFLGLQTSDKINDRNVVSNSDFEEPPPQLHYAETPDDPTNHNTVDPFNFMSTIQRKFISNSSLNQNDFNSKAYQNVMQTPINISSNMILSEGPLSTSMVSSHHSDLKSNYNNDDNVSVSKAPIKEVRISCEKAENEISRNKSKFRIKHKTPLIAGNSIDEESQPQKTMLTHQLKSTSTLPSSLHLRFQAELNHMESIQEAERQLTQINQLKNMVSAAKTQEDDNLGQVPTPGNLNKNASKKDKKLSKSESRANFEKRVKNELEGLINNRMQKLVTSQTEATKVTADAAKQLVELHKIMHRQNNYRLKDQNRDAGVSPVDVKNLSNQGKHYNEAYVAERNARNALSKQDFKQGTQDMNSKASTIPEDLVALISKAESNIPEVLSIIEKTDKSGSSIQKTISEVIRQLSVDDKSSRSSNITEDIAKEIDSDYTSQLVDRSEAQSIKLVDQDLEQTALKNNKRKKNKIGALENVINSIKDSNNILSDHRPSSSNASSVSNPIDLFKQGTCAPKSKSSGKNEAAFFQKYVMEENLKSQQEYALLKEKEKSLADQTALSLLKIQNKKADLGSYVPSEIVNIEDDTVKKMIDSKLERLNEKERKITQRHKEKAQQIRNLKHAIKKAEKTRELLLEQQQNLTDDYIQAKGYRISDKVQPSRDDLPCSDASTTASIDSTQKENVRGRRDRNFCKLKNSNTSKNLGDKRGKRRQSKSTSKIYPNHKENSHQLINSSEEAFSESQDSNTQESCMKGFDDKSNASTIRDNVNSPTSRKENLKKKIGGHLTQLKAPLSPKSSKLIGSNVAPVSSRSNNLLPTRKRHSSAGSSTDDSLSISQADTILASDHSDMDIRINTLQEELKRRILIANKLKRQQKARKKEKLLVQEEALKKQIEAYDKLILKTKEDLEESINSTSSLVIVPPQIKTPRVSYMVIYLRTNFGTFFPASAVAIVKFT